MTPDLPIPQNLRDFSKMFATDEQCAASLFKVRWPHGYMCPTCGTDKAWKADDLWTMHCRNNHKITVTAGTTLHRSKQPLTTWFHAAWLVSTLTPGISAVQFQRQLGIGRYETAFQLLHKLRSALVAPDREPLQGSIEMDESFIIRKDEEMSIIVGAVEVQIYEKFNESTKAMELAERAGRIRLRRIPTKGKESIYPFVLQNIAKGSTLYTDGHILYDGLAKLGYDPQPWVQGKGKKAIYTNNHLHRTFSNLKAWLRGTHHSAVKGKHLQAYLNEFVYRHNRRYGGFGGFLKSLTLATHTEDRPEYETLYAAGEEEGWVHPNPRPDEEAITVTADAMFDDLMSEAVDRDPRLTDWMVTQADEILEKIRRKVREASA